MPHPKDRKALTRRRLLEAASRLFSARGFGATSIDDVMRDCGLTRGGFYAHFRSKGALYEEVIAQMQASEEALSLLASDASSRSPQVRQGYVRALNLVCDHLRAKAAPGGEDSALATAALIVGTLAISSNIDDEQTQLMLKQASRKAQQALLEGVTQAPAEPSLLWAVSESDRIRERGVVLSSR